LPTGVEILDLCAQANKARAADQGLSVKLRGLTEITEICGQTLEDNNFLQEGVPTLPKPAEWEKLYIGYMDLDANGSWSFQDANKASLDQIDSMLLSCSGKLQTSVNLCFQSLLKPYLTKLNTLIVRGPTYQPSGLNTQLGTAKGLVDKAMEKGIVKADDLGLAKVSTKAVAEAHDSKCELWRSCLMNIHLATRGLAERSLDVKSDLVGSISSYIVTPPEFLKAAPEWADVQKNIKDALIACVRSALAKAVNTCMQRRFAIPPR
jgi:hypothetical protein